MSVYSHPIPVNISITVGQLLNGKFAIGQRIIPQITITEIIEIFPPEHRTSPVSDMDHNKPQLCQSLISIGSGGLLGVGLGKSRQKFLFLPEEHNDFIFAVVCEELGLIGACVVMLIFALLVLRGFWVALHARDRFGSLLAVGVTTQISLQVFLNIAVVTGLIPATGISLPFFSYGGTALALQLTEIGIVLSVSRQIPAPRAG